MKEKIKKYAPIIATGAGVVGMNMVSLADTTANADLTTAATNAAAQVTANVNAVIPIALGVMGLVMGIKIGVRVFQSLTRTGSR